MQRSQKGDKCSHIASGRTTRRSLHKWEWLADKLDDYPTRIFYVYINDLQSRKHLHEIAMLTNEQEAFDVLE